MKHCLPSTVLAAICAVMGSLGLITGPAVQAQSTTVSDRGSKDSLVGVWTLTAADNIQQDGTHVHAYGDAPNGLLIFEQDGHYSVEIYGSDRAKFSSGDKLQGSPEEYKRAVTGTSCHYGRYFTDPAKGTITFMIEGASFPNLDGARQVRPYTLAGDTLSWRVPATPDGKIPFSEWRRVR
jgi:Lipocalin-like domain